MTSDAPMTAREAAEALASLVNALRGAVRGQEILDMLVARDQDIGDRERRVAALAQDEAAVLARIASAQTQATQADAQAEEAMTAAAERVSAAVASAAKAVSDEDARVAAAKAEADADVAAARHAATLRIGEINQIVGVVTVGLFAARRADVTALGGVRLNVFVLHASSPPSKVFKALASRVIQLPSQASSDAVWLEFSSPAQRKSPAALVAARSE